MNKTIHSKVYCVDKDEFQMVFDPNLQPLEPVTDVSTLDREIGFLRELSSLISSKFTNIGTSFGGYVSLNVADNFERLEILPNLTQNIIYNLQRYNLTKKFTDDESETKECILRVDKGVQKTDISGYSVVITDNIGDVSGYIRFSWYGDRCVYVHVSQWERFCKHFRNHINKDIFFFDNLINLLIMVKNAGESFRKILQDNLPYFDRYTILDTGSTDNTVSIIEETLKDKDGDLYREPFINFRDSRNRLLELAGNKCVFNIMLDDSYVLEGNLRDFLAIVRSDDKADSFSLYIQDVDTCYSSNRVTKSEKNIRYRHRIHEILQNNYNVCIPYNIARINDVVSSYMSTRTKERKLHDLRILYEELAEMPDDVRTLYYLGETYLCLDDYPNAYEYYNRRVQLQKDGFAEEVQDSLYKMAVIAHLHLGYKWEKCHELYLNCYEYDSKKPESLFMIGKTLVEKGKKNTAFMYLKKAFEIGIPYSNMNNRMSIYNRHLPNTLFPLCYEFDNYALGLECANRVGDKNWGVMFNSLLISQKHRSVKVDRPNTVCFLMDGGWGKWTGKTLRENGIGGSETFIIKFSEYMANLYGYDVIVFCNCDEEVYNKVLYVPIERYIEYISKNKVKVSLINRYSEYTAVTVKNNIPTYVIFHDLLRDGEIIPSSSYLKGLLGISDWHKKYIEGVFPMYKGIMSTISYGIEVNEFPVNVKRPYSFIYSSFPNRGLLQLLRIFPMITQKYPYATLNVFCDLRHKWVIENYREEMIEIERLLNEQPNVKNHGWVNSSMLKYFWSISEVWLYPCTFTETSCLTAFEAAASKTLVITNNIGALVDTVGDRGIIIEGDPQDNKWRNQAVDMVDSVFNGNINKNVYIENNYKWVSEKTYDKVVPDFMKRFF